MKPILRRTLWGLGGLVVAALLFLVFLWFKAGRDFGYMKRVLVHRDSSTDDYRWKRAMPIAASPTPFAWREAPDCPRIAAALDADHERYLRTGGALAFVVVRDGAIVCEWYGNGGARDRPAAAFSVTKTVTSLVLARAIAERRIASIDTALTDHVPALAARDRRFSAITLAHLVDMRSGIAFSEDTSFPWVDQDAPSVYYATDLAKTVVERPRIAAPPGTFLYNDYAPNLVGLALEHAYGTRLATPMQALWSELGAEYPASFSIDDRGFAWHESGFVVTARDLARIGQLMLDDGKVGARQVAPLDFLVRSFDPAGRTRAVTFAGTELGYRNGWWIPGDGELLSMGRHGQVMLVSRPTRTVIVRLGLDGHSETNISIARRLQKVAAAPAH